MKKISVKRTNLRYYFTVWADDEFIFVLHLVQRTIRKYINNIVEIDEERKDRLYYISIQKIGNVMHIATVYKEGKKLIEDERIYDEWGDEKDEMLLKARPLVVLSLNENLKEEQQMQSILDYFADQLYSKP